MNDYSIYTVGEPHTVTFDLANKTLNVCLKKTQKSLDSLWIKEFSKYPQVVICLSGGLDSQFSAHLASKYCSNLHAVTFEFIWDKNVVNADDVCMASKFAKKLNISHQIIEVDLKHFLTNAVSDVAVKYSTTSPQIAAHLYAIEHHILPHNLPILMGGEVPIITQRKGIAVMPFRWPSSLNGKFAEVESHHFQKLVLPYAALAKQHNATLIKDPFMMTPEIYYQSYMQNLQVFKDTGVIISMDDPMRTETTNYKQAYYESFGFDMIRPLKKLTGFERLKVHYAIESGIYDQFDKIYRQPLSQLGVHAFRSIGVPKFTSDSDDILIEAQKIIDSKHLREVNVYDFDW